jgi:hypothetical protein
MSNYYSLKNNSIFNPPAGQAPTNVDFSGSSNIALGNVANVSITGGTNGQVISTDGSGNLSFTTVSSGTAGPKITQIQITDSNYNVLDDTAVSLNGGYIKISGSGFATGAIVIIGNVNAVSTSVVSDTVLNVQVPALNAGTYVVYVVNTDGGTAIAVNGLTYSGTPTWVTGSNLEAQISNVAISIQLNATGDEPLTYILAEGNTLPSGLTLTSSGLLSGIVEVNADTTYSFTIIAIDNELQDSPRSFTLPIDIVVTDPYFYLTTLLLPGNGTNNQNNNVFLDSSNNNFTITRNGNTIQGTFSPFSQTGWSIYGDGTGDGVTAAANSAFAFGTGDFTIEFWAFIPSWTSDAQLIGCHTATVGFDWLVQQFTSGQFRWLDSSLILQSGIVPTTNQWNHYAVSRSGTTLRLFLNGTQVASGTSTANIGTTYRLGILCDANGATSQVGYASNVRIVKGTALYTSNFTPSVIPLAAVSGTSLLTCQSNRFIDNSTNNFTITRNGDVLIQPFSPFNPTSAWSAATNGGSGYFDGSGDWLIVASNAAFAYGTGSLTIEAFINTTTKVDFQSIIGSFDGTNGWFLHTTVAGVVLAGLNSVGFITGTINVCDGAWHHVALVRNVSTLTLYIDGVADGTRSDTTNLGSTTEVRIGGLSAALPRPFTGYISNPRVVKGTAVYTSNFTPPTTPLTNIANTSLLLNFTNAGITDATAKNVLETVGDTKISTVQSKFGGSSIFFDGIGDLMLVPSSSQFGFGTGDFTVEAWVYTAAFSPGIQAIVDARPSNTATPWQLSISGTGLARTYDGQTARTGGQLTAGAWNHVAWSRSAGTNNVYVNGTLGHTWSASTDFGNFKPLTIGAGTSSSGESLTGYIQDLRITKGYARYTANFTPPTNAFSVK